jgi:hypothetical protein
LSAGASGYKTVRYNKHIGTHFIPISTGTPIQPFRFQTREEAFHRRIVPAITPPAQAAFNAILFQQPLKQVTRVLTALVRVMQ